MTKDEHKIELIRVLNVINRDCILVYTNDGKVCKTVFNFDTFVKAYNTMYHTDIQTSDIEKLIALQ